MPLFTRNENTQVYILVGVPNTNTPMLLTAGGTNRICYWRQRSRAQHMANALRRVEGDRYNVMPYTIAEGHANGFEFEEKSSD